MMIMGIIGIVMSCNGYNKVELSIKHQVFSVDYPVMYQYTADTNITDGRLEDSLGLGIPIETPLLTYYDPELSIIAVESFETLEMYVDELWNNLIQFTDNPSPAGTKFELIERGPIIVSGIHAELVIIKTNYIIDKMNYYNPVISRRVYFKRGNMIWIIDIKSSEEKAEQARQDFEHIIDSFKFLN